MNSVENWASGVCRWGTNHVCHTRQGAVELGGSSCWATWINASTLSPFFLLGWYRGYTLRKKSKKVSVAWMDRAVWCSWAHGHAVLPPCDDPVCLHCPLNWVHCRPVLNMIFFYQLTGACCSKAWKLTRISVFLQCKGGCTHGYSGWVCISRVLQ